MPTIKFKLKDPKYCNGCIILCSWFEGEHKDGMTERHCCSIFNKEGINKEDIERPQACIDKYGE